MISQLAGKGLFYFMPIKKVYQSTDEENELEVFLNEGGEITIEVSSPGMGDEQWFNQISLPYEDIILLIDHLKELSKQLLPRQNIQQ